MVAAPAVILAVQLIFFGMPLGLWLRGVILGLLTALLAIGLALVYRANRVVNFSQADLGSPPVALAAGLVVFWGWSYWLGLAIGVGRRARARRDHRVRHHPSLPSGVADDPHGRHARRLLAARRSWRS